MQADNPRWSKRANAAVRRSKAKIEHIFVSEIADDALPKKVIPPVFPWLLCCLPWFWPFVLG